MQELELPEEIKKAIERAKKPVQTQISREEFLLYCDESIRNLHQQEMQSILGKAAVINLLNRAGSYESDPNFRVKYIRVDMPSGEVLVNIDVKPKRVGFNLNENRRDCK